ncbi:hypothetical protein TTHERM_00091440 (macronuclear) [Tetrahymena thermophila SB210]|uniref:Uncharacterized protein n=1 Tax=Tetrahymena thermophila (strain SB210) TaxID=312017 RepID=Q236E9_TETTS|nr:hypothetical protein TTHERM_00091440 [Tetrahymena thermophila SB210]EAR92551.2 hypothetical protein TTHERM_00091440 [Tetrahymena thermophila SB210]|eukprot:XP_001012796.2 hypothetical protein TTHERM_00091440 [Tetrahymena thermophila SB210]
MTLDIFQKNQIEQSNKEITFRKMKMYLTQYFIKYYQRMPQNNHTLDIYQKEPLEQRYRQYQGDSLDRYNLKLQPSLHILFHKEQDRLKKNLRIQKIQIKKVKIHQRNKGFDGQKLQIQQIKELEALLIFII